MMWQPIETAPMDQFLLLCGPSGYTTTPMVVTTGRMCSDYHAGRWIDHANDDLTEWGFDPTHWMPLSDLPGAQPASDDEYVGWYCAHCQRGVDASEVTYHEQHEACGRVITDDRPPKPAPSIPEGWKLVPIEPTPEMIDAAEYVDWGDTDVRGSCINAWDRMLAAAPESRP